MKTHKLLERLSALLRGDAAALRAERASILTVLGKLRAKERKLQRELASAPQGEESEGIRDRLEVIHAQRARGVERLLALRRSRQGAGDDSDPVSGDP